MNYSETEETHDVRLGEENRRNLFNMGTQMGFFRKENTFQDDDFIMLEQNETSLVFSQRNHDVTALETNVYRQKSQVFVEEVHLQSPKSVEDQQKEAELYNKSINQTEKHGSSQNFFNEIEASLSKQRPESHQKRSKEQGEEGTSSMQTFKPNKFDTIEALSMQIEEDHEPVYVKKKEEMIKPLRKGGSFRGSKGDYLLRSHAKRKHIEPLNDTWKERGLFVLFYIRKFIVKMMTISQQNKFRNMKIGQFELINDSSGDFDFFKHGNYLTNSQPTIYERLVFKMRQKIQKSFKCLDLISTFIENTLQTISPESIFKLLWDGFMLFLLTINIFYIPLKIAFEESGGISWNYGIVFFLNDMPGWAFLMDIVVNLNTSFYKKGVIIKDRSRIVKHYLKNQLLWDLIVLIPFFVSNYFEIRYLDSILLLRFNKVRQIANNYLDLLNLRSESAAILDLVKLIIFILFIAHFCGCAFYLVSYLQFQTGDQSNGRFSSINWLSTFYKSDDAHSLPWQSNYITSFYWAVITMITVGYGDITPTTDLERVFVIIITLLSCGVFAYSVNSIGSIINVISQKNLEFKKNMAQLSIHMKKRGLSTELQMKVKKYFEYINEERLEDNEAGEDLLKELAGSIKHEIALEIYGKILNSKKIMKLNFSQEFLRDLAPKLKERRHGPEEVIYTEKESQSKLFFLMKGNVNLYVNVKQSKTQPITIIKETEKGDVFGELSFFSGMASDHSAVTSNVVSLVYINLEDFLDVIKAHPIDRQRLALIKDNFTLYSSSRGLGSQCASCGKFTHQFDKCPIINYVPNDDQLIERFKKEDVPQKRKKFKRMHGKSEGAWRNIDNLKQAAIEMIVEKENIDDIEVLGVRLDEMEGVFENGLEEQLEILNGVLDNSEKNESSKCQSTLYRDDDSISYKKPMEQSTSPSQANQILPKMDESIQRMIRKGQRKQSVRLNVQTKGIGEHRRRGSGLKSLFGLGLDENGMSPLNIEDVGQFKDIRNAIRKATFVKKVSFRSKTNKIKFDEEESPNEVERKIRLSVNPYQQVPLSQQVQQSQFNFKDTKTIMGNFVQQQMQLGQQIPQPPPAIPQEPEKSYSLILDLDVPKQFSHYYPKNNPINTIASYNTQLKGKKSIGKSGKNLSENPNLIKEHYNKLKNKRSASQMRSSNLISAGSSSATTRPQSFKKSGPTQARKSSDLRLTIQLSHHHSKFKSEDSSPKNLDSPLFS